MQVGNETRPLLALRVIAPNGEAFSAECDSVHLPLAEDKNGKGAGSIGIRIGHAKAELALNNGKIIASLDGRTIGAVNIDSGFALVENNNVTVITDNVK